MHPFKQTHPVNNTQAKGQSKIKDVSSWSICRLPWDLKVINFMCKWRSYGCLRLIQHCLHSHPLLHSSPHLVYSAAPRCLRWASSVWDSAHHHERSILWKVHFFYSWGDASEDLRGGIHRSDSGDSLRTVSQSGRLNFCALLRRIDTSKTYILVEGVAWCHRHRADDFPYSFLGFSLVSLTRTRKRHPPQGTGR